MSTRETAPHAAYGGPPATAPPGAQTATWTGLTIALAVAGLLLFMAIPARAPSAAEVEATRQELALGQAWSELRSAIAEYRFDHSTWPGFDPRTAGALGPRAASEDWFVRQLTMHSDRAGAVVPQPLPSHPFGPYLDQGVPPNPWTGSRHVRLLAPGEGFDAAGPGEGGWVYRPDTGEILPDGAADPGVAPEARQPRGRQP